jgi:hypothetical protein
MVEWMLADVIVQEFERSAGKDQYEGRKALHVGFGMNPEKESDQYEVCHMYVYAPHNYVYVALQTERITAGGKRVVGPMKILSCHDSCWRDSIQTFIFKNRDRLSTFSGFKLFQWFDEITLSEDEREYLWRLESYSRSFPLPKEEYSEPNPFDKRGNWAGKC